MDDSSSSLTGEYLGLDSGLRDTELMDTVVETWGMPSKVLVSFGGEAYLSSYTVYLVYDCGEYNVELSVFCSGDSASLQNVFVLGEKQKNRTAKNWEGAGSPLLDWQP